MGWHGGNWWSYIQYDEEQDRPEVSRELIARVARYARPYWRSVIVILVTIVVISLLSLLPPLLIRDLIDHAIPNRDFQRLNLLALGMVAVPLINGLLGVAQRYASAWIGEGVIFDLRRDLYAHLQRLSLRFFTHTHAGELMSRLNNDVVGAQSAITGTVMTLVSNAVSLVATLAIMLSLEWRLTLLGIAVLPLFVLPARRVGRTLRRIVRQGMERNALMNAMMNETLSISGALLVKIFGRYHDEVDRFSGRAADVRDTGVRQAVVGRWFALGLSLVSAIGTALIFWLGGVFVLQGTFTIGTIVAFTAYLSGLYGPLMALTNVRVDFATSMVSFERVFEVLDLPKEIAEPDAPAHLKKVTGAVGFEGVWFAYSRPEDQPVGLEEIRRFGWGASQAPPVRPTRERTESEEAGDKPLPVETEVRWTLEEVSFQIGAGEVAALVGPSGAGKTTITYLVPRLYDPVRGRVTLDGHDLRQLSLDSLADHVGMVTQETYLFHDSLKANLRYAKPEASQSELEAACRAANIHEFIVNLQDGYETIVGERGYRLSGGEKQRVAIARAILKDPRVLILDEATSHLDSQSEALIQEAMQRVMHGRTSIVIAHRLSTIMDADRILVMNAGRLVQQGTHEQLLVQGGLYAQLYETQFHPQTAAV